MGEALILLATNFLWGAYHAIQPGHGKTIAAAYIVGARGRPVDAWILGIFVTLSHTSGIVVVGVLASLGLPGFESKRIEVWLKVLTGALIIAIGLWTLWTQRGLFGKLQTRSQADSVAHVHEHAHGEGRDSTLAFARGGAPAGFSHAPADDGHAPADHGHASADQGHAPASHGHASSVEPDRAHDHLHPSFTHSRDGHHDHAHPDGEGGFHSHGFGVRHRHDLAGVMERRPSLLVLVGLGIAGGLVPDPLALSLLIRALAEGKVVVGLIGVLAFSIGFAAVLVAVGVVAAAVGKRLLQWLAGPQALRLQIGMSLLIVIVGVVLTVNAVGELMQVETGRAGSGSLSG